MKLFPGMKLFIWADPYDVSYGSSMYFAVAESVEEARAMASTKLARAYSYSKYEKESLPSASFLSKEPDRIIHLPCAEWHEWSE